MIRKSRGLIFGTSGPSLGTSVINATNPYRTISQIPVQFGKSTKTTAKFGGRKRKIKRR